MVEKSNTTKPDLNQILGTPIANGKMAAAMTFDQVLEKNKKVHSSAMKKLVIVSIVSVFFITAQLIGGIMAGSIAIFTDSAHLASDMLGFAISMMALTLGQRGSTHDYSFGWHRAEVIGTMISISVIWIMTIWLLGEATKRFFEPPQVKGGIMLVVAIMGLFFNLIQMRILHSGDGHYHLGGEHHDHDHDHDHEHGHHHDHQDHNHSQSHSAINADSIKEPLVGHKYNHDHDHDHDHEHTHDHNHENHRHGEHANHNGEGAGFVNSGNMNIDAAYLHVMGDMLMSVGVIIAAIIIYYFPSLWYADPICTYLFSIIVMFTTIPIVKSCIRILMEGTPSNINLQKLRHEIQNLDPENIADIHDIHVWQIAQGKNTMSAHIKSKKPLKTLAQVTDLVRRKYKLHHTTIQVEGIEDVEENPHHFECANDLHN